MTLNENSLSIFLARIFWMIIGPGLLFVNALEILYGTTGWEAVPANAALPLVALACCLARWIEHRGGAPRNADGLPATDEDLRRYFRKMALASLAIWFTANLAAPLINI